MKSTTTKKKNTEKTPPNRKNEFKKNAMNIIALKVFNTNTQTTYTSPHTKNTHSTYVCAWCRTYACIYLPYRVCMFVILFREKKNRFFPFHMKKSN